MKLFFNVIRHWTVEANKKWHFKIWKNMLIRICFRQNILSISYVCTSLLICLQVNQIFVGIKLTVWKFLMGTFQIIRLENPSKVVINLEWEKQNRNKLLFFVCVVEKILPKVNIINQKIPMKNAYLKMISVIWLQQKQRWRKNSDNCFDTFLWQKFMAVDDNHLFTSLYDHWKWWNQCNQPQFINSYWKAIFQ